MQAMQMVTCLVCTNRATHGELRTYEVCGTVDSAQSPFKANAPLCGEGRKEDGGSSRVGTFIVEAVTPIKTENELQHVQETCRKFVTCVSNAWLLA